MQNTHVCLTQHILLLETQKSLHRLGHVSKKKKKEKKKGDLIKMQRKQKQSYIVQSN